MGSAPKFAPPPGTTMLRLFLLSMGALSCIYGKPAMPKSGDNYKKARLVVEADVEVTTEAVGYPDTKMGTESELETTTFKVDPKMTSQDQETTTEAMEKSPEPSTYHEDPTRSSPGCKSQQIGLMKKKCTITGQKKQCQTFDVEIPTIADYEFCQNVTALICQQLSTTREGQQRQLAPEQYSDAMDSSDYDLKDYNYNNKDSADFKAQARSSPVDVCVTKVTKVGFPSQKIEKSTVQKEFCWEEDIVSCQDEVEQMVDTVICNVEELPQPQVRATTEEPEATTFNTDQMGRIMVVGNMTTPADDQETTTPSAAVASFKNSTEYPTTTTTTTTTESVTTASEYNMVRIVVETTLKPETTEDPEAEPESEPESEPTSSAEVKAEPESEPTSSAKVKAEPQAEPKAGDDNDNKADDDSDNMEQASTTTESKNRMKARVTTI